MTNSTDLNKTLDSQIKYLVWNLVDHYQNDHPDPDQTEECRFAIETIEELLALIQTVGEGLIPERKELLLSKEYATPRELLTHEQDIKLNTNHQIIGYNQAISDVRKAWGLKDV